MKFGVVVFPGSNCDEDMLYLLGKKLNQEVVRIWHKDTDLQACDFVFLPGGFSYGDYLRSGAIARFSPIMNAIVKHANEGGYVMGICNGFQILTESHLLPGTLLKNLNRKYICKNVYLKPSSNSNLVTRNLDINKAYNIPIAHGDGRFFVDNDTLKSMWDNEQILFQYADAHANIKEDVNPNGSIDNIAGICNQNKNVFGMMPHPERSAYDEFGISDGMRIFESILDLKLV
jgi:phosphoribosylformylglycinamidine synthase subunit PurQ / glutaminase